MSRDRYMFLTAFASEYVKNILHCINYGAWESQESKEDRNCDVIRKMFSAKHIAPF